MSHNKSEMGIKQKREGKGITKALIYSHSFTLFGGRGALSRQSFKPNYETRHEAELSLLQHNLVNVKRGTKHLPC
jgi:hypothetical protein